MLVSVHTSCTHPNSSRGLGETQSAAIGAAGAATIRAADRGHVEMILQRQAGGEAAQ